MFLVTRHTKKKRRPVLKPRLIYLQTQRDYTQIFDTDDSGTGRDGILQQYRIGFGRYTLPLAGDTVRNFTLLLMQLKFYTGGVVIHNIEVKL